MQNPLIQWEIFFPFAIWYIWTNRNHNMFNNSKRPINNYNLERKVLECIFSSNSLSHPSKPCLTVHIKWYPPTEGFLKLNIDGSYNRATNIGGIGGVVRDANGRWVMGFYKKIHHHQPYFHGAHGPIPQPQLCQ
ncbi:hypothetical protein R3W88_024885 [Solanum pinnatisectum]|uniref:RNase H type-1 domain-containing protein n=1 Tax=Solanum pinnatisectum TaxID=50273 RepID=A0AAV9M3B5_9SOLN|nr:hypothetical protein R3W88_024885 [Solanum pinnatisectum]